MTKHLRFLFIALLMAVWTGAWAQDNTVSLVLSSTAKFKTSSGSKLTQNKVTWTVTKTSGSGTILNNFQGDYNGQQFGASGKPWGGTFSTSDIEGTIKSIAIAANTGGAATLSVKVGNTDYTCNSKTSVAVQKKYQDGINTYTFIGNTSGNIVITLKGTSKACYLGSIKVTYSTAPAKTSTHTTFGDNSKKKFTFVNGVLEGFTAPTATVDPAEAQNAMEYWSDNENVVKVNPDGTLKFGTVFDTEAKIYAGIKDGNATYEASSDYYTVVNTSNLKDPELAFNPATIDFDVNDIEFKSADYLTNNYKVAVKYYITPTSENAKIDENTGVAKISEPGEYTITAKFEGNDTYKPATATCKLVVTNGIIETKTVTFVAGVDKGLFTSSGVNKESMTKQNVTIKSTRANFSGTIGKVHDYRFYKSISEEELGETTFSTTLGKITKIEFIESSGDLPSAFETSVGTYDKTNYVWTGEEKNVTFTTKALIRATKIIVTLAVPQAKAYTFDETNDNNIVENYENANVTLKRSNLVTDSWNTFCVPFAISAEEIATTWGEGTELRTFDRMSGNTMYFKKVESIEAGKPYLVKPANATTGDLTFNGVQTVVMTKAENTVGENGFYMVGTYNAIQLKDDGSNLFLTTENKFNRPIKNSAKMKGMRVYFEVPTNTVPAALRANIDGVETGINVINGIEGNTTAPVYNLQGQCVGNSLRSLAPGIYVQGGKKYVVK